MRPLLITAPILLLGLSLGQSALAAEPCPWEGTEHSAVCGQWEALAGRLEAAETRARNAEQSLQALQDAMTAMEQTLEALVGESAPAMPEVESDGMRARIDAALAELDNLIADPLRLSVDREYTLSRDGERYQARFPRAALHLDEVVIDLSPLELTITPLDDARIAIDMRIPGMIPVREDATTLAKLNLGGQTLTGVWSDSLESFTNLELDLRDLSLSVADVPLTFSLSRIASQQTLLVDDTDSWQQRQTFNLADLRMVVEGSGISLTGLDGELEINGQRFRQLRELTRELQQLNETSLETMGEPPIELFRKLTPLFTSIDHYRFQMTGNALTVHEGGQTMGQLERMTLGSRLDSMASGSRIDLSFDLHGLETAMAPLPPGLMPDRARLEIILDHIPPRLVEQLVDTAEQSAELDAEQQEVFWQQQLLGLLMNSGLELRISDSYIAGSEARTDLNLRAAVDPDSILLGSGELLLRIVGLEQLIAGISGQENPAAAGLTMLMAFSNRIEENGRMVDVFDLKFTPDGKLMLNNKDVSAMFMP